MEKNLTEEQKKMLANCKYYKGEDRNPFSLNDTRHIFWFGEEQWIKASSPLDWIEEGKKIKANLSGKKLELANKYDSTTFGIIIFIETLYSRHDPYDNMRWIYEY